MNSQSRGDEDFESRRSELKDGHKSNEKKDLWTVRWDQADFNPRWALEEFPVYIQDLIDDGSVPDSCSIVDIGCGSGFISAELSSRGYDVLGFDFAEPAISKAIKEYGQEEGKLEFVVWDATVPLLGDRTFQVGIDRGTLPNIPRKNLNEYVDSLAEIIENDGLLVLFIAKERARKLFNTSAENIQDDVAESFTALFTPYFELKDVSVCWDANERMKDMPLFRLLFRRSS